MLLPLPSGLFPCLPSDSGTQLSAFPFSVRCLASQWLPQRLGLLPFGFPASSPWLSLSVFPLSFRFLSSASVPLPATQLSVSSVPFFLAAPLSGFSSASVLPFGFPVFHLLFRLVSHASFPVSGTWLSVRFLSSFPVSLPQPFHRCFPSFPLPLVRFFSGLFCLLYASFRPLQPASDYSAFCVSFPFFPFSPHSGLSGAFIRPSVPPVSMLPFRLWYSAFPRFLSPLLVSPHRCYFKCRPLPFSFRPLPLAFALGSGYLAGRYTLKTEHCPYFAII